MIISQAGIKNQEHAIMPQFLYKVLLSNEGQEETREKIVDIMNGDLGYYRKEFNHFDKNHMDYVYNERLTKERQTFFIDPPGPGEDVEEMFMWSGYLMPGKTILKVHHEG